MEGNQLSVSGEALGPRPIGRILAAKKPRPRQVRAAPTAPGPDPPREPVYEPEPEPAPRRRLTYPFVPFPTALADLELRQGLPPVQLRVLQLRRFANPVTGEWLTSTREVADFVRCDRSTAHKALWSLCAARYLHITYHRSSTVQLILYFGGFMHPGYLAEGKTPLVWDAPSTMPDADAARPRPQNRVAWHTAADPEFGSMEDENTVVHRPPGTAPRTKNTEEEFAVRSQDELSPGLGKTPPSYLPVATFQPSSHDESVVQDLARKLGEPYMNSFLSLRRQYGRGRLEKACAVAADKRYDRQSPLRGRPGAYVRWLLESGKC